MKEDAAAKELEELLRDALKTGLEPQRGTGGGASPLVQLKTVPLQVQSFPKKAVAVAVPAPESTPDSIPGLADKLAPESVRPPAMQGQGKVKTTAAKPKSRSSAFALLAIGAFAVAAAGGAFWLRTHHVAPVAESAPSTPATQVTDNGAPAEGAVGISVAARPTTASAPEGAQAKPVVAAPVPVAPAEPAAAPVAPAPAPAPVVKAEAKSEAKEPKEAKADKAEVKPKHSTPAPRPEAQAKADKAASPAAPEKTAAPAPAQNGSVDALLQQQLKGAIP